MLILQGMHKQRCGVKSVEKNIAQGNILFIIGNGFDLHCGLKSSYNDFFEYLRENDNAFKSVYKFVEDIYKKIRDYDSAGTYICYGDDGDWDSDSGLWNGYDVPSQINILDISIWELYFICLYLNNKQWENWADIEKEIENLLVKDCFAEIIDKDGRKGYLSLMKSRLDEDHSRLANCAEIEGNILQLLIARYIKLHADGEKYGIIDFGILFDKCIYPFLLAELKKFEDKFEKYLEHIIDENKDYYTRAEQCFNYFRRAVDNDAETFVLNFNYTDFLTVSIKDNSNSYSYNTHGVLGSDIIFGVDNGATIADNAHIFTKTHRKMAMSSEKHFSLPKPNSISSIKIYGHSLGKADYSYFQSIFDYYNIYESDCTLEFFFSYYKGKEVAERRAESIENVYKMVNTYGGTLGVALGNQDKGKNLLHKLLLDGRLSIMFLENDFDK
jgi:hypothetical protein